MLELQLRQQLANVARRIGRLWLWRRLTWLWVGSSLLVFAWALLGQPAISVSRWYFIAAFVASLVWIRSRSLVTAKAEVARRIEQAFPDLKSRLLAAIEQSPDTETGRFNVLQRQVIAEAIHHARMNDWSEAVSPRTMRRALGGQILALMSFIAVGFAAMQVTSRSAAAISRIQPPVVNSTEMLPLTVEPGNAELERGTSLLVLARFLHKSPAEVDLIWKGADEHEHRQPLAKSLEDPVFAARLSAVKEDILYRIAFDTHETTDYRITVYDLPTLVRSDLQLTFPGYTNLEPKVLADAFEATVVEGTQIAIHCHVNKPLVSARLLASDNTAIELRADSANPLVYRANFTPTKKLRLSLELLDGSGRKNRDPEQFRIDVVPNRTPDLKLVFPGKDVKVSPLEEIEIEASATDDFGVLESGLMIQATGREPIKVPLGRNSKSGELQKLRSIQRLEDFRVQPDELVTYYLYAIDFGADGQPRQTNSDVYFAEVRSFDEIYRQVDQQGAGEMQNSQKPPDSLAKLLELQKQIIVATWKLARNTNPSWEANSTQQVQTIHDSQLQAIEKLRALRERLSQPQLQSIFAAVADSMEKAQKELGRALGEKSFQPLNPASAAEQSAYQGLLKLRAKEHLLVQAKAKGNGQENEEKEKLDLELKRNENRYESEKLGAKKDESNVNREALAVLDRLKELANRQDGLNQQIKELEAQMRDSQTDVEREEIQRRLKRLREEQQQLLHDADELRNRLNNSTQRESVAETKQQLEQTRQRMVETAEKLREGQLSQALAAGTRTERELKQIHDDFRQKTAAQFADAMRSLREEARQVAGREKQLAEQLMKLADDSHRTLRPAQERSQLQSEFQQQRRHAAEIMEKAKQVVEQSEASEPLLSKQLYDTIRSTRESKLDQALTATEQLLKQGVVSEAAKAEQQATTAIDQLKQGIEKAAESVLGNEVDSLKRARKELAELSQQLEKEIQAKEPGGKSNGLGKSDPPGQAAGQAKSAGQGTGAGQEDGEGAGSPNPNGSESSPSGASDASSPAKAKPAENGQTPGRKGPVGLRASKATAGPSSPAAGRKESGDQNSNSSGSPGNGQGGGPLTGGEYTEFNERLRDVESMISDPRLQAEVQKVRDRARSARAEFKRHTQTPNWNLVRTSVHQPMIELQQRLAEEIAKRESPDSLVPVDRDPVPTKYRDLVRSYYEKLGSGKQGSGDEE